MPRPLICRRVAGQPGANVFKPAGRPLSDIEEIQLTFDELEALRLADLEGQYQEDAARKMGVSRQTFGNIVESARRKVADALVHGKALRIQGGVFIMMERHFICFACKHKWTIPYGTRRPGVCPGCHSSNIHRAPGDQGNAWAGGGGWAGRVGCGRRERRGGVQT